MLSKHKFLWLIPTFLIITVIAWCFSRYDPLPVKLSSAEEMHVNTLLSDMKTHCIGRYLIDIPASFQLSTGSTSLEEEQWVADINWPERSYKAYIASKRMYYPAFERLLKRREKELSETRTANPVNMPFLKKNWPLPAGMKGVIFERNLDTSADDALRTLEAYVYSNDVAIKIQKKSANDLAPRYKKDRERRGSETNYIPGDIDKINDLLSRIRGRESGEVPREPGSCIANAFIAIDKSGREQEDITLLFSSKKLPGVNIEVSTNNFLQSDNSLLDRVGEISDAFSRVNASILDKGSRKIN